MGIIKAEAQNVARRMTDAPANLMTPTIFAKNAVDLFQGIPSVKVIPRDKKWAEKMQMNTFLSVAKGSNEPPVFLEVHYRGNSSSDCPIVLIGEKLQKTTFFL